MPKVTFILADGSERVIDAPCGLSLMEIARAHELGIEGTCEGSMACATCHMILAPADSPRLRPPCAEEEEMLDLAVGVQPTSRLGCQIRLSEALDGLTVRLPAAGGWLG